MKRIIQLLFILICLFIMSIRAIISIFIPKKKVKITININDKDKVIKNVIDIETRNHINKQLKNLN